MEKQCMLEIELAVYEKLSAHGVDMTFEQARLLALQFLMGRERRKRQIGFSAYAKEGDPPLKPLLLLQTEL